MYPFRFYGILGQTQPLILSSVLPFLGKCPSDNSFLIRGVSNESISVPLQTVYLTSNPAKGPVTMGVINSMPFPGVQLLLGNDLAGEKVVIPNPIMIDNPLLNSNINLCEDETVVYPSCVITRTMKRSSQEDSDTSQIDLGATVVGNLLKTNPQYREF